MTYKPDYKYGKLLFTVRSGSDIMQFFDCWRVVINNHTELDWRVEDGLVYTKWWQNAKWNPREECVQLEYIKYLADLLLA